MDNTNIPIKEETSSFISTKTDIYVGYIINFILLAIGFAFTAIEHNFAYVTSIFFITIGCLLSFYIYTKQFQFSKKQSISTVYKSENLEK